MRSKKYLGRQALGFGAECARASCFALVEDNQGYPLIVRHEGGRLSVTFGAHTTELSHWQNNSFYVRAPTRLTFDWLLTFAATDGGEITKVTVKHIGWDKDEKDHLFVRDGRPPNAEGRIKR